MLPLVVSLFAAAHLAMSDPQDPTWKGRTAQDWAKELASGAGYEVFQAFAELDPRSSLPVLVDLVKNPDPEQAWLGVRAMAHVRLDSPTGHAAGKETARALEKQLSSESASSATLAAMALGILGGDGGTAARQLMESVAASSSPRLRLACALALTRAGGEGTKAVLARLGKEGLVAEVLAHSVLSMAGKEAASAKRKLGSMADRDASFRGFLLAESALRTLEHLGSADEAADAREKRGRLVRQWVSSGSLNWGGMLPSRPSNPAGFVEAWSELLKFHPDIPPSRCAVPREFHESNGVLQFADACQQLLAHLGEGPRELAPRWRELAGGSWDDFEGALAGWEFLCGFLIELEKQVPKER